MNNSLEKRLADTRAAHEALLHAIAAYKANPSREARAKVDNAAMKYEDLMLNLFDPDRPSKRAPGRPLNRWQPSNEP